MERNDKKERAKKIMDGNRPRNRLENAILAHSLMHGLASIKWSLKMILSGDFGKLNDEQKRIIEKNLEESERLIMLANNLLSDENNSKTFLNKELHDIRQIIYSVIKSCKIRASEKKIALEFIEPEEKEIEALIDKEKIKISIQNILDNAIRYSREGGKVVISLGKGPKNLEVKIQDSGIGIPESQKEKLFTKFFRGTNATQMNSEGSGLGLFIARNIIHAHGGKIWFDSKEDKGSTFYFSLPIKK